MYVFIADIHIRPGNKEDVDRFVAWADHIRGKASAVYILGDLFDYWYTGLESRLLPVLEALSHPDIHILPGNRDFLLKNFRANSMNIIDKEEYRQRLFDKEVLIAHGHTLTDADLGFRILHRLGWPALRLLDRVLPVSAKDRCARLMVKSSSVIRPPHTQITEDIASIKQVDLVICGHLHRYQRLGGLIVLPAFFDTRQWMTWDDNGMVFHSWR